MARSNMELPIHMQQQKNEKHDWEKQELCTLLVPVMHTEARALTAPQVCRVMSLSRPRRYHSSMLCAGKGPCVWPDGSTYLHLHQQWLTGLLGDAATT